MFLFRFMLFIYLLNFSSVFAQEEEKGTLIVSYNTGERAERLNRVRFSLIADDNTEEIYPKGEAFVEGSDCQSRLIVIELCPGNYRLQFLIPNSDHLFETVPEKILSIEKDKTVRIDQFFQPRYSTLKVKTQLLPDNIASEHSPKLTLEDTQGTIFAHSVTGKLVTHYLIPGKYLLKFETLEGYHAPNAIPLDITADKHIGPILGTYIKEGLDKDKQDPSIVAESIITRRPSGTVIINQINAQLTINNNLPDAHWTLIRNNTPVYEGQGSVKNFQVLDGDNYRIVPEQIEGYAARVSPSSFSLYPAQTLNAYIVYERSLGTFSIQTNFPNDETLIINLKPPEGPPTVFKMKASGGKINWQSPSLPIGNYELSYTLPANFNEEPIQKIMIRRGERLQLHPEFEVQGALRVIANIPDAIFLLKTMNGSQIWKGEGREFTFLDVPSGTYLLSFSSQDPSYFFPPKDMKFTLTEKEKKEIKVSYQIAGKLTIKTNVDRSLVTIQEIGGQQKKYQESILNHSKDFNLPEGRYRITLTTVPEDKKTTANLIAPDPVEITIKPLNPEEVNLSFRINEKNASTEKQRRITVQSGISNAGFTIYKLNNSEREFVGHYSGKNTQVTLPSADQFEVVFDEVPNYQTPVSTTIEIKAGEDKTLLQNYLPLVTMIQIPAGRAIIGDSSTEDAINASPARAVNLLAYSIGTYEVTNAEFAAWLNNATKVGTISYIKEADNRGRVVNMKDQLLFKTFEADAYSQISAQLISMNTPTFMPLAGKDSYPVINVTWYGALEYCKDNKCRLPSEAEWEKAAGMAPEEKDKPLKKYRFGFGQNTIDRTWANYKDNDRKITYFKVLTTPVGFYNGSNILPLDISQNSQPTTQLAKSPYGAFDMSGNVWEWVNDWYDETYYINMPEDNPTGPSDGSQKVAKGGCYDSLEDGVRVSERMALPLDYCDAYTGFRIAK